MRISILLPLALAAFLAAGATLLCCNGCAGVNLSNGANPSELPEDDDQIQVVGEEGGVDAPSAMSSAPPTATPPETPDAATDAGANQVAPALPAPGPLEPLEASTFKQLQLRGVRGGELAYELDGAVEDVVAMLLDQDGAGGHRAWAQTYREASREGDRVVGEWHFRGKMGVNPVVEIEFVREREGEATRIRYKVVKRALGIKSFFGDYHVAPVPGVPSRSRLTARVFIDSGLPFVNASHQDIQDGLREDARLMREWMTTRLAPSTK